MALCGISASLLCACSPEPAAQIASTIDATATSKWRNEALFQIDCGNIVTGSQLSAYVDLIHSLDKGAANSQIRDERLFSAKVRLKMNGVFADVSHGQVAGYSGLLPTLEDWRVIAKAIAARNLRSGGWRGCFLSGGKAAFEADVEGRIGLSSFDFDRQWETN
jgi:hypothetical protein